MLKKICCLSLICALTLSLQACIPAVFVAGATVGGAVLYDKRSMKEIVMDQNIANQAQTLIARSPQLKDTHITVTCFHQVVLIVGQAPTPEQRALAYQLVSQVPNIKRIYNRITIAAPSSAIARANDSWITSKVKTMMIAKPGLRSSDIKIITEDGTVYLMGNVTPEQEQLAVDVARRVAGVQTVVKVFQDN